MEPTRDIPKVVIIDFDGTLCRDEFPNVGPAEPHVREALLKIKEMGYKIHVHSCRTATYWGNGLARRRHVQAIRKFLEENNLPYDEIVTDIGKDKPVAQVYIDDRAIGYRGNWLDVVKQMEERKE